MSLPLKTVCIIGGGGSGLTSAKYAAEQGLQPTIFEKTNQPGNLFD